MLKVMVAGAGKIGVFIAYLLQSSGDYHVCLVDKTWDGLDWIELKKNITTIDSAHINLQDENAVDIFLQNHKFDLLISSLPYFLNVSLAKLSLKHHVHYFDITEDVAVTKSIKILSQGAATMVVPQCGLAPGIINILASDGLKKFDEPYTLKLRVGALPQNSSNTLHYALTWSTDGLINEYGNPCEIIENGRRGSVRALDGLELIEIDGATYEAFYTSGGLGSLPELYDGILTNLDYKTIRYPGHRDKIHFLMHDLNLNKQRDLFKQLLEHAIPRTYQDVVIVYVEINGMKQGHFCEHNYSRKFYPQQFEGMNFSAIQISTASSVCAVVDYLMNNALSYRGWVYQEQIPLEHIQANRFGKLFS